MTSGRDGPARFMNRRRALATIASGALASALPIGGLARRGPEKTARIVLAAGRVDAVLRRKLLGWLAESGYVIGRNLEFDVIPVRHPSAKEAGADAAAVLAKRPDLLLIPGVVRVGLFRARPASLPLVFLDAIDDAAEDLMADAAARGERITGTAIRGAEDMPGNSWESLVQLRPGLKRIGDLHATDSGESEQAARIQRIGNSSVARKLAVGYRAIPVAEKQPFDEVAASIRAATVDGVGVAGYGWPWAGNLVAFLERSRLPAVFEDPTTVRRGGLMSVRNKDDEAYRQGIELAVRILAGEDPASLPVRFVDRSHLALNLRTARAIGLAVPAAMVARADEVVR